MLKIYHYLTPKTQHPSFLSGFISRNKTQEKLIGFIDCAASNSSQVKLMSASWQSSELWAKNGGGQKIGECISF